MRNVGGSRPGPEQQLKIMSKDNPVRYLGFFQSPDKDWEDMVRRVLEETRKACDKLERHYYG